MRNARIELQSRPVGKEDGKVFPANLDKAKASASRLVQSLLNLFNPMEA